MSFTAYAGYLAYIFLFNGKIAGGIMFIAVVLVAALVGAITAVGIERVGFRRLRRNQAPALATSSRRSRWVSCWKTSSPFLPPAISIRIRCSLVEQHRDSRHLVLHRRFRHPAVLLRRPRHPAVRAVSHQARPRRAHRFPTSIPPA